MWADVRLTATRTRREPDRALSFKIAAVVLPTFAAVAVASAETKTERADALFREGRQLMASGDLSAACAKFSQSNQVEASIGALLNLGECEIRRDDPAAAWLAFRRAQLLAKTRGDSDRAEFAVARMQEVKPRLGFVSLEIAPRWQGAENLTVHVDDRPLLGPEIDRPIPLNPGTHKLVVSADGARPLERQVAGSAGESLAVEIDLEPAEDAAAGEPRDRRSTIFSGGGKRKVVGMSMTAGGGAVLAAGIGVAIAADSETGEDIAMALLVTGALATGAGVALWLTAKPPGRPVDAGVAITPVVGDGRIGFAASGSF